MEGLRSEFRPSPPLLLVASTLAFLSISVSGLNIGIGNGGGISIGVGGPSSQWNRHPHPHPPPTGLQPCDFENMKQYQAYKVIQRFKTTITCDPQRITDTWVGPKICNYKGFACDTPPGTKDRTIAATDFNGYGVTAPTVCGFIDQLPDLAIFHANSNNLTGPIPDLTNLNLFYELDLSNNKYNGQVPVSSIVKIPQLAFLDLRFNAFKGTIPPSLFTIRPQNKSFSFDVLFLNNNGFVGYIPSNLGSTTVKYLTLANNQLTGPIPSSIGQTGNTLQEVLFLNNKLSGCLPYEIGYLRKATVFDAGTNLIEGPIPCSFGCLTRLEQLNLARNRLSGEVPDAVCRLGLTDHPYGTGRLANLSLSDNYFTSLAPSCWWLVHKGILDVRKNCIVGLPEQRSIWECKEFLLRDRSLCTCPNPPNPYGIPCKLPPAPLGGFKWDDHETKSSFLAKPAAAPAPSVAYGALHHP